jgi:hypothetical protein
MTGRERRSRAAQPLTWEAPLLLSLTQALSLDPKLYH